MKLVRPKPQAKVAVFYSSAKAVRVDNTTTAISSRISGIHRPCCVRNEFQAAHDSAWRTFRLRSENQLGFKMVKWIQAIEFVENVKPIYKGEGGYAEDHEFFGSMANI